MSKLQMKAHNQRESEDLGGIFCKQKIEIFTMLPKIQIETSGLLLVHLYIYILVYLLLILFLLIL